MKDLGNEQDYSPKSKQMVSSLPGSCFLVLIRILFSSEYEEYIKWLSTEEGGERGRPVRGVGGGG